MAILLPSLFRDRRQTAHEKEISADHPTWCPGCGDSPFGPLFQTDREAKDLAREHNHRRWDRLLEPLSVFRPGAWCPLHSRSGTAVCQRISLSRPDLHVFVFGGDGTPFQLAANHLNHTARKNIKMTYVIMDNWSMV